MKSMIFAASLLMSGAAIAQTTPTPPAPGAPMTGGQMTPPPASPDPMMDPAAPPAPGTPMAPGAPMAPGTPMTPDTSMAQPGPMQSGMQQGTVQFAPPMTAPAPAPRDDYPVCSRTVTDSCRNPGSR